LSWPFGDDRPAVQRVTTEHGTRIDVDWTRWGVRRMPAAGSVRTHFDRDNVAWSRAQTISQPELGEVLRVGFSGSYLWGGSTYQSSTILSIRSLWARCPVCRYERALTRWGCRCWRCIIDPRRGDDPPAGRRWQERVVGAIDNRWITIRAWSEHRAPWSPPARRRRRERRQLRQERGA
jgi:hypothetical protein